MLWTGPARDWFAGRPVAAATRCHRRQGPERRAAEPEPAAPGLVHRCLRRRRTCPRNAPPTRPRPPRASATSPAQPDGAPVPPQQQWAPPQPGRRSLDRAAGREPPVPTPVKVACAAHLGVLRAWSHWCTPAAGRPGRGQEPIVDYVRRTPAWQQAEHLDRDMLLPVLWLGCLLFLAWSVGALVLAWFTWRRHNWARYLLAASAAGRAAGRGSSRSRSRMLHQLACVADDRLPVRGPVARLVRHGSRTATGRRRGRRPGPAQRPTVTRRNRPTGRRRRSPASGPPPDQQGKPPVW